MITPTFSLPSLYPSPSTTITGLSDDKRRRATVLADRAGCYRRDRKLELAVADLDNALCLFPRYAQAMYY